MVQQPGRKSAAASLIKPQATAKRRRLSPVLPLTDDEQAHFAALLRDNPHLVESDAQMLTQYVVALSKAVQLARDESINDWDKACRLALQLGTKLRLLPSTSQDPQVLGRRKKDNRPDLAAPWDDYITRMNHPSVDFRSESQKAAGEHFMNSPEEESDA